MIFALKIVISFTGFYDLSLEYLNPEVIDEAEVLLLKTIERNNEFIDGLPDAERTAEQMGELWEILFPQLKVALTKSAEWAREIPIPDRK